jgi:hypothetical protein
MNRITQMAGLRVSNKFPRWAFNSVCEFLSPLVPDRGLKTQSDDFFYSYLL